MTIGMTRTSTTGIAGPGSGGVAFGRRTLPGGRQALTVSPRNGSRGHVVVLPGIHGQTPHVLSVCQQLAEGGTTTVVIGTYGRATGLDGPAAIAAAVAELDDDAIAAEVGGLCAVLAQDGPVGVLGELRTPVLGHYGTIDSWCENRDVDDLEAVLQATGGRHAVYRCPGAGHAFAEPGGPGFRVVAAAEAAARTSVFLEHYLG